MSRASVPAALLFVIASCGDPAGLGSGGVEARLIESGMIVENQRQAPIYYFAVEAGSAIRMFWAPCTDPVACPAVGSEGEETVPYQGITAWNSTSSQAVLYWWHLVADGEGGFRADSIRAVVADR